MKRAGAQPIGTVDLASSRCSFALQLDEVGIRTGEERRVWEIGFGTIACASQCRDPGVVHVNN